MIVRTSAHRAGLAAVAAVRDRGGAIVAAYAVALPALMLVVGLSVDYAAAVAERGRVQQVADAAAIAGAKELSLADAASQNVPAVVEAVVLASMSANSQSSGKATYSVATKVTRNPSSQMQVEVDVSGALKGSFGSIFGINSAPVAAKAVAVVVGKPNVCLLAIDQTLLPAIHLQQSAKVIGQNCGVYANSKYLFAIWAEQSSLLSATVICSAGGMNGGKGNFNPSPLTDCPQFDDPLAGRPEPTAGACAATNLVIDSQTVTLAAGTYCGGITARGTARVTFGPGVYIMKDGPLNVLDSATADGDNVGFHFNGQKSNFLFAAGTTINLTAPKSGIMAGILFFGGRKQLFVEYKILSDNARQLLGTIYLPMGHLTIDANQPIADKSAYTALVLRRLTAASGPTVTLNTNYDQTDVPVPDGIRGAGQPVALTR